MQAPAAAAAAPTIDQMEIRVGTITAVSLHPNAESLYLEEIDVGEDKPRIVISGLVKFVPQDQMLGRRVAVVLNLKPSKMRDVISYGMVRIARLCCMYVCILLNFGRICVLLYCAVA